MGRSTLADEDSMKKGQAFQKRSKGGRVGIGPLSVKKTTTKRVGNRIVVKIPQS